METPSIRQLVEKITANSEIKKVSLPSPVGSYKPVLSAESLSLHHGKLYQNYIDRAHQGEGKFYSDGAKLHGIFFEQLIEFSSRNQPTGEIKNLIEKKFGSFGDFVVKFTESAKSIQGSGWAYLSTTGSIKTIKNHEMTTDILLLVDMWEHSYILDYGSDKDKYIKDIWKIINWDVINKRIGL